MDLNAHPSRHADETSSASSVKEKLQDNYDPHASGQDDTQNHITINESKLLAKIDMRIVPVLCAVYLLAFLDRVNIGNAALFGLKQDLNLGGNEYNTALVIFFVPYVLFEVPSNILLKKLKPNVWLSVCLFGFGVVTVLQGLTQNYSGILATRFFLGLFESGMLPGCYYLLSMWYRRAEAQKRYTFLFSATSLAGAFGGLLASAIGNMNGIRGFKGWRWVFILEGILTCVGAIIAYFIISDFPERAKWITEEEKALIKSRLQEDVGTSGYSDPMTIRRAVKAILNYKFILGGFMYFGLIVPAYSIVYFAPSIISNLGHGNIHAQLLSVPPFASGFVISMVVAAISDYFAHRFIFGVVSCFVSIAGFAILLAVHDNPNLQYGAIIIAATGTYTAMPIMLCWFGMNVRGHLNRAVATGYQIGFGNIGGIIASYSFLAKDAPEYLNGYRICISFVCLSLFSSVLYFVGLMWENRRADRSQTDEKESGNSESGSTYRFIY